MFGYANLMKSDDELSKIIQKAKSEVQPGEKYRHYKGNLYTVLEIALIEATLEPAVMYRAEYGAKLTFIRTVKEWSDQVTFKGKSTPRFSKTS